MLLHSLALSVVFISIVSFINGMIAFVGDMFHYSGLSLGLMAAKILQPFVWFLGIDWTECEKVCSIPNLMNLLNK